MSLLSVSESICHVKQFLLRFWDMECKSPAWNACTTGLHALCLGVLKVWVVRTFLLD